MSHLILGLATEHPDTSAALVNENGAIAAISEERITRKKHTAAFPSCAIREVLRIAGADLKDVTDVAVARDPAANALSKIGFILKNGGLDPGLLRYRMRAHRRALSVSSMIAESLGSADGSFNPQCHRVEHHLAHISSAFYWSPFEKCVAFSVDGAGDFATSMWGLCQDSRIKILRRTYWPHSLGVFYTAMTQFLGFDQYGEEYKVMGLSAYGKNTYADLMQRLVTYSPDKGLQLNLEYFTHHKMRGDFASFETDGGVLPRLWSDKLARELGPARIRGGPMTERENDIAASMQVRYEEVFLSMVSHLTSLTSERKIVLAGGSALNSVANGRMLTEGYADDAYFQPAASDDGTSLGAALYVLHSKYGVARNGPVTTSFLGPEWSDDQIEQALRTNNRPFKKLDRDAMLSHAARALTQGNIVGWFQGREEWGPRALGNRSILCNPSLPNMKAILNARIKNREPFRPFAPTIREEDLSKCFEGSHPVPFMIVVYKVRPEWRAKLPAITHEDNTGRVQTVRRDQNALYYDLITRFQEESGVPVVLNTSFNENEPIVHTPVQAIDCFERTRMDCLGIGSFWLEKEMTTPV